MSEKNLFEGTNPSDDLKTGMEDKKGEEHQTDTPEEETKISKGTEGEEETSSDIDFKELDNLVLIPNLDDEFKNDKTAEFIKKDVIPQNDEPKEKNDEIEGLEYIDPEDFKKLVSVIKKEIQKEYEPKLKKIDEISMETKAKEVFNNYYSQNPAFAELIAKDEIRNKITMFRDVVDYTNAKTPALLHLAAIGLNAKELARQAYEKGRQSVLGGQPPAGPIKNKINKKEEEETLFDSEPNPSSFL